MKKIVLLIFALLLAQKLVWAQKPLSGTIFDAETGEPVSYAQIIVKGTAAGTTSDAQGNFSLPAVSLPVNLVISDIRYQTTELRLQSYTVLVRLQPKVFKLEEVVIRPEGIERVLPEPAFSVIDYGFYDDLIVMAVMKNRRTKAYIRLQQADGKLLWERRLPFVPERFFEDCLGNLHLLSADSAYQLYYDYVNLHLLYAQDKEFLLSQLFPCKAFHQDKAYFQYSRRSGLINQYIVASGGEKKLLYSLADSSKINYLNSEYDLHYFLKLKTKQQEPFVKLTVNQIKERLPEFQAMIGKDWLDQQILEPIFAPLHKTRDDIAIFDFKENRVLLFGENDSLQQQQNIRFHQEEGWTGEVMTDPASGYLYAPKVEKGEFSFMRIDPRTFRTIRHIPVTGHDFIRNYQIRNGFLYFVDRDLRSRDGQTYSLYRVKI